MNFLGGHIVDEKGNMTTSGLHQETVLEFKVEKLMEE